MMEPWNLNQVPSVRYDSLARGESEAIEYAESLILLGFADHCAQEAIAETSETRHISITVDASTNRLTIEYSYAFSMECMLLILKIDLSLSWLASVPVTQIHDQFRAEIARIVRLGEIILPQILRGVFK